jgi:hypothetical protein
MPSALREQIKQAKLYSTFQRGVYGAYRWSLCDFRAKQIKSEKWAAHREQNFAHFEEWYGKSRNSVLDWNIDELFEAFNIPKDLELVTFYEQFQKTVRDRSPLRALSGLMPQLKKREFRLKHNRSHFEDLSLPVPENVEGVNPPGDYDYRFPTGRSYAIDILRGRRQ